MILLTIAVVGTMILREYRDLSSGLGCVGRLTEMARSRPDKQEVAAEGHKSRTLAEPLTRFLDGRRRHPKRHPGCLALFQKFIAVAEHFRCAREPGPLA